MGAMNPRELGADAMDFVSEHHLATLTTLRSDGSPHVVAVGFTYDEARQLVRVITFAPSVKARNATNGARAAVSQVDGARWITFEGPVSVTDDADEVASAVSAYAARYRQPKERTDRVVIEIAVDRVMGSSTMRGAA
ncbi:MAG: class F420-dependent oxidoreductase [Ilumatobacteraceae bacterium]|nr:class F420-dependent oxidoreductase [Ilumatobacteraceae bacterium]